MKKNWYLVLSIVGLVFVVTAIPNLIEGIEARGFGGVNYGSIGFPLIISIVSFVLYRKRK